MDKVLSNQSGSNTALRQHLFQPSSPENGHTSQRKRKRKECEECQRRKRKCDMTSKSKCSHCVKANTPCSVAEYRRQRILNNLSRIDHLEIQIERMEACLQKIGVDFTKDATGRPSTEGLGETQEPPWSSVANYDDAFAGDTTPWNFSTAAIPSTDHIPMKPALWSEAQSSMPKNLPCSYIPRCFADIPNAGKEWINHKMGGESFENLEFFLSSRFRSTGEDHCSLQDVFSNKVFCPLPPKDEIASLVDEYLQQFNVLCPLFQSSSLLSLFDDDSLHSMFHSTGRWASINVVLAMGYMLRIKDRTIAQTYHQKSWLYMKNALGVLNELCFGPPDLWAVQALLGMVVFLLGTLSNWPCSCLISSAVRICHHIRLERSEDGSGLCPEELEQRRRVFWIAYCLDKDISLRFGSPLAQNDDDMDVLLPMEVPTDNMGTMPTKDPRGNFNAFRACCELALIKSQLHKHLYSVAASERPLVEVAAAVGMLDRKLQQWKESIPAEYRPEVRTVPTFPQSSIAVILLFLHLSYFNCLIAIHHVIAAREASLAMDLVGGKGNDVHVLSNPVVFMSESLCVNAATASVNLMEYMPESNIAMIGIMIYYPIIASRTLSLSIIRNPRDISRAYYMRLMTQVETFVSSLVLGTPNEGIKCLLKDCAEYRSLADAAIREAAQIV